MLVLPRFEYGNETGFVSLAEGSYEALIVTAEDAVAIAVRDQEVAAGGVYTAIARDPAPDSAEFGVILIAD